jgi:malate synthase
MTGIATAAHRAPLDQARANRAGLAVAESLIRFVEDEALPGTGIAPSAFWPGLAALLARFTPRNRQLLAERERLQGLIDAWHRANPAAGTGASEAYLRQIGYLVDEPPAFVIATVNVDPEISNIAGPQLVVPVLNARFALNAANARWGSLYDALYGTDALGDLPPAGPYCAERGAQVVAWAMTLLDDAVPLVKGSWRDLTDPEQIMLADPQQLAGRATGTVLLRHHGLHIEVRFDRSHPVGAQHPGGIADVVLESALTTIVDFEDSVAAVDAEDKVAAYRNWLGLMRGNLTEKFEKNGQIMARALASDRSYRAPDGSDLTLPGRSLLLVRNVGHLMTTPTILDAEGAEVFEGLLDAILTCLIGLHDLRGNGRLCNSRAGNIYVVKPKMHGPAEAGFANDVFDAVEDLLGLARHTIKIGVMDEERRTSANLAACIAAVKHRIFFINTGFLDRTGDEIHTSMLAGPFARKGEIKQATWISAYEARNVAIGIACGFVGRAQIGKGMWAAPDQMAAMLAQKGAHPHAGANSAWVPSPTAATLHATHYHRCDVVTRQQALAQQSVPPLAELLQVPLGNPADWSAAEIAEELDNNLQGILGYVVRWVDQGIGCSKVPDIHDVALMEDRATLRISSQHVANWLLHGIVSRGQVEAQFQRMAARVDQQNAGDPAYRPMAGSTASLALDAARTLVFAGVEQPNGYTERVLHRYRIAHKS